METIINFIKEYWPYLSFAVLAILEIIFVICKKRPKVYGWFLDCLNLVMSAESLFVGSGRGSEKLKWVVEHFIADHDLNNDSFNIQLVTSMVEKILSSPSKKGEIK